MPRGFPCLVQSSKEQTPPMLLPLKLFGYAYPSQQRHAYNLVAAGPLLDILREVGTGYLLTRQREKTDDGLWIRP